MASLLIMGIYNVDYSRADPIETPGVISSEY